MGYQTIFRRYEFKYLLKREEKERLLDQISCLLQSDLYPQSTVRNIYFNTENDLLIRRSMEKPIYKEKLRIRSYRKASCDSTVFVELKKKYRHVVYKRRVSLAEKDAREWLCGSGRRENPTQIEKEIDYFLNFYSSLKPSLFLSYDRVAFADSGESDLRITFDENILFRRKHHGSRPHAGRHGNPGLRQNGNHHRREPFWVRARWAWRKASVMPRKG